MSLCILHHRMGDESWGTKVVAQPLHDILYRAIVIVNVSDVTMQLDGFKVSVGHEEDGGIVDVFAKTR